MTRTSIAPSQAVLRPMGQQTATFPVYPDLVSRLCAMSSHPNPVVAHVLATCAGYAYADEKVVGMIMARMGLEENHCFLVAESVDAMFIRSTAYLVQSADGRVVILCFRGTEPTNVVSWLTDVDINPTKVPISFPGRPGTFDVHGGFYRNVRATRYEIAGALKRALNGESVSDGRPMRHPLEALYVTGHSLGGAMAAITALMLTTEEAYAPIAEKLRAVYTYGQPMIGTPEMAAACATHRPLAGKVVRYVHRRDVVPQLPPRLAGPFAHFGAEYQYRGRPGEERWQSGPATPQMGRVCDLLLTPLGFLTAQIPAFRDVPFRASIGDHLPHHYIATLTPPGVRTEYGD